MMDFSPGLRIVRRFWIPILVVALVASVVAYAASFMVTPVYSSATRVLVRAREARLLSSTGQDLSSRPGTVDLITARSLNQTLAGLATSRPVAEEVVRELELDKPRSEDLSWFGQLRSAVKRSIRIVSAYLQYGFYAEPPAFEGAVTAVQRSLEATPVRDSYLIEIKARADDPQLVVAIADAATRAFVRETRAHFQDNAATYREFLREEADRARGQVEEAEASIRRYKEANGVTDIGEALKLGASSEESMRQQLRDTDAELNNARARLTSLRAAFSRLSPSERTTSSVTSRTNTSTTAGLETGRNLSTSQNDAVTENTETRDTIAPNRVYQDVQRSLVVLESEIAGLEAKRAALAQALSTVGTASGSLAEHAARLSELELQRSAAHGTFTAIQTTYEGAVLNDTRGAEEVRQIDQTGVPLYPDRPLRYLFALFGLICGIAGGIGLAYFADRYRLFAVDRRPSGASAPLPEAVAQPTMSNTAVTPNPSSGLRGQGA
jgi:uncharacterized protein involved in exopolysaccharide biosynthesis